MPKNMQIASRGAAYVFTGSIAPAALIVMLELMTLPAAESAEGGRLPLLEQLRSGKLDQMAKPYMSSHRMSRPYKRTTLN